MALEIELKTDTERLVEVPWLLERIGKPAWALDIGSAGGFHVDLLADLAGRMCLVDLRPPLRVPHGADFYQISAGALPESWRGRFDLITCISVLDHIGLAAYGLPALPGEMERTVAELARVTARGGRLLLTVPAGRDLTTQHGRNGGQRVFSLETLRGLFPDPPWEWLDIRTWRLAGNIYVECPAEDIKTAGYAGHRAAAVAALELRRR